MNPCRDNRQNINTKNLAQTKHRGLADELEPFMFSPFDFTTHRLRRLVRIAVEDEQISVSKATEILNFRADDELGF